MTITKGGDGSPFTSKELDNHAHAALGQPFDAYDLTDFWSKRRSHHQSHSFVVVFKLRRVRCSLWFAILLRARTWISSRRTLRLGIWYAA